MLLLLLLLLMLVVAVSGRPLCTLELPNRDGIYADLDADGVIDHVQTGTRTLWSLATYRYATNSLLCMQFTNLERHCKADVLL
jgi:hypothetical protein